VRPEALNQVEREGIVVVDYQHPPQLLGPSHRAAKLGTDRSATPSPDESRYVASSRTPDRPERLHAAIGISILLGRYATCTVPARRPLDQRVFPRDLTPARQFNVRGQEAQDRFKGPAR
jgi:hypothetical protein